MKSSHPPAMKSNFFPPQLEKALGLQQRLTQPEKNKLKTEIGGHTNNIVEEAKERMTRLSEKAQCRRCILCWTLKIRVYIGKDERR